MSAVHNAVISQSTDVGAGSGLYGGRNRNRLSSSSSADKELSNVVKRLNDRLNEPFVTINTVTGDMGIKKAQEEYQRLIRNKTNKRARS